MDKDALLEQAQTLAATLLPKIVAATAILLLGVWIAKVLANVVRRTLEKLNADPTLVRFLGNLTYVALLVVVVLSAVSQLGVETTSFIAILGAAGLAIGLALQSSLSNFAAGVLIVLFRPYRVGDFISAAGIEGSVLEVQMFTTVLKTPDNKRVIVPNGQVMKGVITNFSAHETRRIDLVVGAGYDDDMRQVKDVLNGIIARNTKVLTEPAAAVFVLELGASSVNFAMRAWVKTADFIDVKAQLTEEVKRCFDEEGLHIPYPQVDNHLHRVVTPGEAA